MPLVQTSTRAPGNIDGHMIKGILSFNLDWQFVLVGVFIAIVMELCGIKSFIICDRDLSSAFYYFSDFYWGAIRGLVDWRNKRKISD
jgi:hypothetical protein